MLFRATAVLLVTSLSTAVSARAAAPRDQMLVSAKWVHDHLSDPNLVLLQIGTREEYDAAHIAGARFLELGMIAERAHENSLELPPVARLDSAFAALGVTRRSRIVLYFGSDWLSPTTRAWLTLEYLGLGAQTSILDGGLPAWNQAGYPTTAEAPAPLTAIRFGAIARPGIVVDADYIRTRQGQERFRLIDARDPEFYRGLMAGSNNRSGHLPGAKSLPFGTVSGEDGRFLPDSALRRLFKEAGVSRGDQVVAYCHIGQQATAVVFAGRLLGLDIRLYDGSFQDWARQETNLVVGAVPGTRGALISPADLAERIARNEVTVIDLRSDLPAYLANHLPGAVYLHYETLRAASGGVPGDVLPVASYASIFSRLGIRPDRPVVVYGSGDAANFNATFLTWLLAGFRHPEVYLLDGGYTRWTTENRPLSRAYPAVSAVPYPTGNFHLDLIDGESVAHMAGHGGVVLVDVRPADQYLGTAGAQLRRGHIPGAINHFWQDDLVSTGAGKQWRSVEELRAAYTAQGITQDKFVIVYCNTGTEASHAYFALHFLLGYPNVAVYAPSWTEYAARADWPIESGAAPAQAAAQPARGCGE